MFEFIKRIFRNKSKLNISNVRYTFLRKGKTITNQKFVTTPKPKIKPAPQKASKNYS
jgi:hypothetical protein